MDGSQNPGSTEAQAGLPGDGGAALTRLVVFSDDWGRHPSSCQHLIRRLLDRHPTLWLNTVGTRAPRLTREDVGKIVVKLRAYASVRRQAGAGQASSAEAAPANLTVVSPVMWPGFRARWQKRVNRWSMARAVHRALGPRQPGERRVAITTLPITADLVGRLDVDAWIYYCVDDFSVWPGLDAQVMLDMERDLVERVDCCLAVSQTLADRLTVMRQARGPASAGSSTGASACVPLLTHGIDLAHWRGAEGWGAPSGPARSAHPARGIEARWEDDPAGWLAHLPRPMLLFWGLIDARLDRAWLEAISRDPGLQRGAIVLIGPQQSPDPAIARLEAVHMPGPVSYDLLPRLAREADVLIMPYVDQPVTRAMNPLKFKEYLACDRPVVARRLPATEAWADAADLVESPESFVSTIHQRLADGLPDAQRQARDERLPGESWDAKAGRFAEMILFAAGRSDDSPPRPGLEPVADAGLAPDLPAGGDVGRRSDVSSTEAPRRA